MSIKYNTTQDEMKERFELETGKFLAEKFVWDKKFEDKVKESLDNYIQNIVKPNFTCNVYDGKDKVTVTVEVYP